MGMGPYVEGQVLSWILLMPGATALALLALGAVLRGLFGSAGLPGEVWRAMALGSSALTFLLMVAGVLAAFDPETIGLQLVEYADWLPNYGVQYFVAVDGINVFLVLLTTLVTPLALLASWTHIERSLRSFVFFVLMFESAMLGVFLSFNVLLFHLFWQLALVSMYFIIGIWGGRHRIFAATKFLLHCGIGSMLMWVVILVLFRLNLEASGAPGLDLVAPPGIGTPGLLDLPISAEANGLAWWRSQTWLFMGFALAFAVTLPLFPLHSWFPDALAEAPTSGSALMAALLLQMGAYGLVRFAMPLFPDAATALAPAIRALALVSIAYAGMCALFQQDLKRTVAYLAMVQAGFVLLGLFSSRELGLVGGMVGMVSRGLTVAALILLVGMLEDRRRTRQLRALGGLAAPMPVWVVFMGVALMASVGVPGSSGFIFELLVFAATFETGARVGIAACLGGLAMAACLFRVYRKVAFGPVVIEQNRGLMDIDWRERGLILALLVPVVWIGLYPNPWLRRIEPSVLEVGRQISERQTLSTEFQSVPATKPREADSSSSGRMP